MQIGSEDDAAFAIGGFAAAGGVNVETVRYYQARGLLQVPARPLGGIRRYSMQDLRRLRFIKSAQQLGFSLDEVGQLLRLEDGTNCHEAAEIAARRLEDVQRKLSDLQRMESALAELLARCKDSNGNVLCPLISTLQADRLSSTSR